MRLIDADVLKDEVLKWLPSDPCGVEEKEMPYETDIVVSMMQTIEEAPTIEPKRGEWKKVKNVHAWDVNGIETWGVKRKCTNCDFRHTFIEDHGHYNFCPNCGADMRKERE